MALAGCGGAAVDDVQQQAQLHRVYGEGMGPIRTKRGEEFTVQLTAARGLRWRITQLGSARVAVIARRDDDGGQLRAKQWRLRAVRGGEGILRFDLTAPSGAATGKQVPFEISVAG